MAGLAGNRFWDAAALRYANDYKILFLLSLTCCGPFWNRVQAWLANRLKSEILVNTLFELAVVGFVAVGVSCFVMG